MNRWWKLGVFAVVGLWSILGQAATTVSATTPEFRLSIKHDGIRTSLGEEVLRFSSLWDGDAESSVTIEQDGVAIATGLTGEGSLEWKAPANGTYVLTHTTYTNGGESKALNATFVVSGKDVPFPSDGEGAVSVEGYNAEYDGAGHGIVVTVPEINALEVRFALAATGPYSDVRPLFTNAVDETTVWCELKAPGYITQTNSATIRIAPRKVTVASANKSKSYDRTPLMVTADDITLSADLPDGESFVYGNFASRTTVGESAASFTVTAGPNTLLSNYEIAKTEGRLTVTKSGMGGGEDGSDEPGDGSMSEGGLSKFDATAVFDGEGHTIETNALVAAFADALGADPFEIAYVRGEEGADGVPVVPTEDAAWTPEAPAYTNAGSYVVWYRVTNENYEPYVHVAKVTIIPRSLTVLVSGHNATVSYDTAEHVVSGYEISCEDELYDAEAKTLFSGTAIAVRTDAGTTAMGLGASQFANSDANFDVTYAITDGILTIAPRVIGDAEANWDIRLDKAPTYSGEEQMAPIIQVCYVKPDGNLDNIPYELSGHVATDAGNYKVTILGKGNYTGSVERDWAIMPRNVKLTSGSAVWEYDGAEHAETTVTVTGDGFVGEEGVTFNGFPKVTHVAEAAVETQNTFSYELKPNTKAQNYEITTENGTVRMTKRPISLTAPTKSKTYDGTPLTFTESEIVPAYLGEDADKPAMAGLEAFSFSGFASITEAGQTAATFAVADGTALMADYAISVTPGATLTVQKSATEIGVTAKSGSWTYDGAAHQLREYEATNLATLQTGDALEVTFDEASVVTTPVDGPEQNGVVANTITGVRVLRNGTEDVSANYTLAWYPGTLTVTKRPVTLASKSAAKAYDGTPLVAHEVTVSGDGFVGEDGATYAYTGTQTEKGTSENTFTYTLNEGTEAAFYAITTENGTLEVTAADITDATDEDWAVVLGPALTYTGMAQVQTISAATFKGLPLDYSVTGNQQTDAGDYELTLTGQGNFSGTHTVAWSIASKALTLTAGNGSKVYDGAALTVGAVTADGFVAGEGATYTCDGSQTSVGSSANGVATITWNANTKGSNYAVTKVPGTLTVTPRPVTVTSRDISKPYDGTPLALTAGDIAVSDIVPGESLVYSDFASRTEAGQTTATFNYVAGVGTDLANYTITPVYGTITITKSATEIGVTAASESWTYDGTAHSNRTYTATNLSTLQAGDELEVTFDEASVVMTPTEGPESDGKVPNVITSVRVIRNGTEDVTANYMVAAYPGVLTVTKRPVTVTVTGHVATNVYDAVEHTVSGYEIATEDELYNIAADTTFSGTGSASGTEAGTYAMNLAADQFANANDNFEVTYAVTDGHLTVTAADITADEADDFVLTLGANPTYNGTVQTIPVTAVTYKGLPVTYTLAGENATHAGTYMVTVKANGNFVGEKSATWKILKRQVTMTSASATRTYDATPLKSSTVSVSGDGFIGLEGATYTVTGAQTDVGSSKNAFTYALKAGTLAGDYEIVTVQGDLTVTLRAVTLVSASASKVYDAVPLVKDSVSVKLGSLGFAGSEGFTAACSGTITDVGTTPNAFTYTLTNGAKAGNYTITTEFGTLTVTKATLDTGSVFPGLETWTEENGFDCTRIYNGKAQPFEVAVAEEFAEEYEFLYALTPGVWTSVAPTRTTVEEGPVKVYFKFVSPNFEPYEGYGTLQVVEMEITDEMVQPGEDAFFFDGDAKKPTVDVVHEVDGQDVCTESDYTLAYGEKADTGWWVTVTGHGNYSGTVTKIVPVLKRPVVPPVYQAEQTYSGSRRRPSLKDTDQYTVVSNEGGIDVGTYTFTLRLNNPGDYRWEGLGEDEAEYVGAYVVKKATNLKLSTQLADSYSWTNGVQDPTLPARINTQLAGYNAGIRYRAAGADLATETDVLPTSPGKYVARYFWPETKNYEGYSKELPFEILAGPDDPPAGDHTTTTPEPVPYVWLDPYLSAFGGDYEAAGHAIGANGVPLWESYVAGLNPTDPLSRFSAKITMGANNLPIVSWNPALNGETPAGEGILKGERLYRIHGKKNLEDATWTPDIEPKGGVYRFYKITVELPK